MPRFCVSSDPRGTVSDLALLRSLKKHFICIIVLTHCVDRIAATCSNAPQLPKLHS
jgi:hypothetical protein